MASRKDVSPKTWCAVSAVLSVVLLSQSTLAERNCPAIASAQSMTLKQAEWDMQKKFQDLREKEAKVQTAKDVSASNADLPEARLSRDKALEVAIAAEDARDCISARLYEARTWRYGALLSVHSATAANHMDKYGAQFQFIWHPYRLELLRESESVIRWSSVKVPSSDRHEAWVEVIERIGWAPTANLHLDMGLGIALRYSDTTTALTGDVGIGLRHGQWLRFLESTGIADARFYVQPWVPTNGEPAAVFFGIEFGAGVAGNRIGKREHLNLGDDYGVDL